MINRGAPGESTTIYLFDWDYTSSVDTVHQRQRLLISLWGRSSESRTGENPMSGSTRGLREGRYGSRIEAYRETSGTATDAYSHCTEVLLYKKDAIHNSSFDRKYEFYFSQSHDIVGSVFTKLLILDFFHRLVMQRKLSGRKL